MQFHQGSRLKFLIENSTYTKLEVCKKLQLAESSLYGMFKMEEILSKKIKPILDLLGVSVSDFYRWKPGTDDNPITIEALRREIELLKEQIAAKDEIISLLKNKRK